MHEICRWLWTASAIGIASAASAAKFENTYLSFSIPDGWKCKLEVTEYVCWPPGPVGAKSAAILIMTAKEVGPQDTLAAYTTHLAKNPPAHGTLLKPPVHRSISGTLWVDATLVDSEVPGFETRYLGTVKDGIAVLMTISVHRKYLQKYEGIAGVVSETITLKPRSQQ